MRHFALISRCLFAAATAAFLTGCLMRQTVTNGNEVVKDGYVVKRPLRDALQEGN